MRLSIAEEPKPNIWVDYALRTHVTQLSINMLSALTLPPLLSRREARLWGSGEGEEAESSTVSWGEIVACQSSLRNVN